MSVFTYSRVRILNYASADPDFRLLRPSHDLRMLVAFLDRFDRLGWIPPLTIEKRELLAAHDVIMHHAPLEGFCFYEFCSKGARNDREPWISIFFHVDANKIVRICGVMRTDTVRRRHLLFTQAVRVRVQQLVDWLRERQEA
jgi:hypothetical protein